MRSNSKEDIRSRKSSVKTLKNDQSSHKNLNLDLINNKVVT